MAQIISNLPQTNPSDTDYPWGSFLGASVPTAKDGTPYRKEWPNDIYGLLQKLLSEGDITPSGVPDTVQNSDYYDALLAIMAREFGSKSLRSFTTVAAMVVATDLNVGDLVITEGYLSSNDNGGSFYKVVAAATGTADGGEFIDLVTPTNYQAQLVPHGEVCASQFGAVGDGTTDDTTKLQALLNAFNNVRLDTNSKFSTLSISAAKKVVIDNTVVATGADEAIVITGNDVQVAFTPSAILAGDSANTSQDGIVIRDAYRTTIMNPRIAQFLNRGIYAENAIDFDFDGVNVTGVTETAGVHIYGTTGKGGRLAQSNLSSNKVGLLMQGASNNIIDHVKCDVCTDAGMQFIPLSTGSGNGSNNNKLIAPRCNGNLNGSLAGIHFAEDCDENTLVAAECNDNVGAGVLMQGIANHLPRNNKFVAPVISNNVAGGMTLNECGELDIIAPTITNNTGSGIATDDSIRPKVSGGLIDGNTGDGIRHNSSLNPIERGVTFSNNGGRGVFITDSGTLTPKSFRTVDCHFDNNVVNDYEVSGSGLDDAKAIGCTGYVTENSGAISAKNGDEILHGLSGTPASISVSTSGAGHIATIDGIFSSFFELGLIKHDGTAVTTDDVIHWKARLH